MKIVLAGNSDIVIYNFRKELVYRLLDMGHEVYIMAPYGPKIGLLVKKGAIYVETAINRHGTNIIEESNLFKKYYTVLKHIQPNCVCSYTVKPNLYCGFACSLLKIAYIPNITGLGIVFEKGGLLSNLILIMYRMAFRNAKVVFVQNEMLYNYFSEKRIIPDTRRIKKLCGSGVNAEEYSYVNFPKYDEGEDHFLFVGRVMKDKGIDELLWAFEKIKIVFPKVKLDIVGYFDGNYKEVIESFQKKGTINYWGYKMDVKPFYEKASALVLPSYHEGMANVLLEAEAMGRPVIASNIPGCKDSVRDGKNGILVDVKNKEALYEAMLRFVNMSHIEKLKMGVAARIMVEKNFNRNEVVEQYLMEIKTLENCK